MSLNASHCYAVITDDEETAKMVFDEIEKAYEPHWGKVVSNTLFKKRGNRICFENGQVVRWIRTNQEMRGYRFHGLFVDHSLSVEYVKKNILPYLRCSVDDIAWI